MKKRFVDTVSGLVEDFLLEKSAAGSSRNTKKVYRGVLFLFQEFCFEASGDFIGEKSGIEAIDRRFASRYFVFLDRRGYAPATINLHLKVLRSFFRYVDEICGTETLSALAPFRFRPIRTLPKGLSSEEVKRMQTMLRERIAHPQSSWLACRDSFAILLLLLSGARASGVLGLRMDDLFFSGKSAILRLREKGDRERTVALPLSVLKEESEIFLSRRSAEGIPGEYLFATRSGRPVEYNNLLSYNNQLLEKAGIGKSGLHLYRHTLAIALVRKNVNLATIQEILGHANIETTRRFYAMTSEENKQKALADVWENKS